MDYPQPDTSAIVVPGWDAAILERVERQLARLVGPVAKLMVRRAAAVTSDVDELYRILADKLTERDMRTVLLYGWNRMPGFRSREATAELDQARATGPAGQSKLATVPISPPGWDAAVLRQVEQQLARLVGPVARLLVRREAAGTTAIDVLYRRLARNLTGKQDRAEFLEGRDRLRGVPPRKIDVPPGPGPADQAPAAPPIAHSAPEVRAISPPGWDPAVLEQVEQQLAGFVGPAAGMMVRRSAESTTEIDGLYLILAAQLRHGTERAAFLEGRDRLQGVPPREVDAPRGSETVDQGPDAGPGGQSTTEASAIGTGAAEQATHSGDGRPVSARKRRRSEDE